MELKEVKCENCGKPILILDGYVREKMFCSLGCMTKEVTQRRMIHN